MRARWLGRIHNILRRSVVEIEPESAPAVRGGFLFQRYFSQIQAERVVIHVESAFRSGLACTGSVEIVSVITVDETGQLGPAEEVDEFIAALLSQGWCGNRSREQGQSENSKRCSKTIGVHRENLQMARLLEVTEDH